MLNTKWDIRFIALANQIANWSKNTGARTGALIVRPDKTIASYGYNGFPRGIDDLEERYRTRAIKQSLIIHAEINAIIYAKENLADCTLYISPFFPCRNCANVIIQSGIKRVVANCGQLTASWESEFDLIKFKFDEAEINLELVI